MFSGIVEMLGYILQIKQGNRCLEFIIKPESKFAQMVVGESVSVNGVCLTVTHYDEETFTVTAVHETLSITNLNQLNIGNAVNLERALKLGDRIGGHCVQGHIDGLGKLISLEKVGDALLAKIAVDPGIAKYIVNKAFITLDGMSITVIEAAYDWFSVTFIPHTQAVTIIKQYQIGCLINIEVDITSKYIEKLMGVYKNAVNY